MSVDDVIDKYLAVGGVNVVVGKTELRDVLGNNFFVASLYSVSKGFCIDVTTVDTMLRSFP